MRALCTICSEVFQATSDVSATPCGHTFHQGCLMQWLCRGTTCPQCRKVIFIKDIIQKLYFDAGPECEAEEDPDVLRSEINAQQADMLEQQNKIATLEKLVERKFQMEALLKSKAELLEGKLSTMKEINESLTMQLDYLSRENCRLTLIEKELADVKTKLRHCDNLEVFLNGSTKEMNEILEKYTSQTPSCRDLAQYCSIMKQNYIDAIKTKQELKYKEKTLLAENSKLEKKMHVHEKTIRQLELDLSSAKLKIIGLEDKVLKMPHRSISGKETRPKCYGLSADSEKMEPPEMAATTRREHDKENGSPHLPLKECSIAAGIAAGHFVSKRANARSQFESTTQKTGSIKAESDLRLYQSFNIMKRQAATRAKPNMAVPVASGELGYNGLGGHSKPDLYPSGKAGQLMHPKKKKTDQAVKMTVQTNKLENYIVIDDDD